MYECQPYADQDETKKEYHDRWFTARVLDKASPLSHGFWINQQVHAYIRSPWVDTNDDGTKTFYPECVVVHNKRHAIRNLTVEQAAKHIRTERINGKVKFLDDRAANHAQNEYNFYLYH